jgi:hypothetical protein
LVEAQAVLDAQPKNFICNFRAPNLQQYQRWKAYVQWAKDNGTDVYHLTLSLIDAFSIFWLSESTNMRLMGEQHSKTFVYGSVSLE